LSLIDFFILGAPKAGTTALHSILNQHTGVFLPSFKEPHFFATDLGGYKAHASLVKFMELYEDAGSCLKGDASIFNLYSDEAVKNILSHNSNAKFIIVLRRQYETVPSFHSQLLFTQDETEPSLESAWELVESRVEGDNLPKTCRCDKILNYKEVYKYGAQIERLLELVSVDQISLVFHEDLKEQSQVEFKKIMSFLNLPYQELKNKVVNENEMNRLPLVSKVLRHPPEWLKTIKRLLFGENGKKIYAAALKLNTSKKVRDPLCNEFKNEIINHYKKDIVKLERLTSKKLNSWYGE
jgi:hypothetical protein